uniref:Putative acetyltransferase n=1 Tax=Collimonas sp. MPS11E8 TaxID=716659 RepID=E8ZA97_9BURK|nr:putative acetyltransferase [Collimonas sp. MPS11E8]
MNVFPLETARLVLRPFTKADLPAFTAYRNQPDVALYQSWSSYSAADAEAFFAQQDGLAFNSDESWFQIAVERKEDGVLVGDVAVHFFDDGQQAELGVTFELACQRLGYAQEAVSAVIQLLFAELGKHRLVATVDVLNQRAQRLLDLHGFRREGHYRENILFKGSWSDEYSYALLSHEWKIPEAAVLRTKDA